MSKRLFLLVFTLSLLHTSISFAHDTERINQLELEVLKLKQQVSELQSMLQGSSDQEKVVATGDGWKSLANWKKLHAGMGFSDVRKLLGEPEWTHSGNLASWHYKNNGKVSFFRGVVDSWEEPR